MGRYGHVIVGGVLALLAIVLVLVLRPWSSSSPRRTAVQAPAAPPHTHAHVHHRLAVMGRATKVHPDIRRPVRAARIGPLPRARVWWKPWHADGTSLVASARKRWLAVYTRPRIGRPALFFRNPDNIGSPRAFLVYAKKKKWVRVYLPSRPNMTTGWLPRRVVRVLRNPYRIVVRLRAHRLELYKGTQRVLRAKTVVGKPSTPTPAGLFFIVDLMRTPDPNGAYGPYAFNLSAHSRVFFHFAGGDGVVAIHGTNEPSLLGQSASHGCIRVSNAVIRRLAHVLPLGTPVVIRA